MLNPRRRRALFRATHRGTREADFLIGRYATNCLAAMDESELDAFEALLELPDPDLVNWLLGRETIPPEAEFRHTSLLLRIVAYHMDRSQAVQS